MLSQRRPHTTLAMALAGAVTLTACASSRDVRVESDSGDESGASFTRADRIPAGTEIRAELENRLSVDDSREGDTFHATVDDAVTADGRVLVPEGALVHGEVTAVQRSDGEDRPNVLKLHFTRIDIDGRSYPLDAELTDAEPKTDTGETLAKIGAGTAAGAVIGGIIGEDVEGALIGAGIGAAAGTAVALGTRNHEAALERGSDIRLRLVESIDLDRDRR